MCPCLRKRQSVELPRKKEREKDSGGSEVSGGMPGGFGLFGETGGILPLG